MDLYSIFFSLLAGRQSLVSFHPLQQGRLAVSDGAADLDEGGPVAAHARLCEIRLAHAQNLRCFFGREELNQRRGRDPVWRARRASVDCEVISGIPLYGAGPTSQTVTQGFHPLQKRCLAISNAAARSAFKW